MQTAPGKPAPSIPPAPGRTRRITPHITTAAHPVNRGYVVATFTHKAFYPKPSHAPVIARLGADPRNKMWSGEVVLQTFHHPSETIALAELIGTIDTHAPELWQEGERDLALGVLQALEEADATATPWSLLPFHIRGPKPRRQRNKRIDPVTGKKVHVYVDTYRRHADPNCPCPHCAAFQPPPVTEDPCEETPQS